MKLSEGTLKALTTVITGNPNNSGEEVSFNRTRKELVDFFYQFGLSSNIEYSRADYTMECLQQASSEGIIRQVIESHFRYANYVDKEVDISVSVEYLNKFLVYDGFKLVPSGFNYIVTPIEGIELVELETPFKGSQEINHAFIEDQIAESRLRIEQGDFDGAITSARSLLEAVLQEIELKLSDQPPEKYNGKLSDLYKRVRKMLNLDPEEQDVQSVVQILTGLNSIVQGLAGLRNSTSDSHVPRYRASRHHAELAVNVSRTLCSFLFSTFEYQIEKGMLQVRDKKSIKSP